MALLVRHRLLLPSLPSSEPSPFLLSSSSSSPFSIPPLLSLKPFYRRLRFNAAAFPPSAARARSRPRVLPLPGVSTGSAQRRFACGNGVGVSGLSSDEDLGEEGEVFKRTLRLVECAMFASVAGLTYLLSNSLGIENYFGCFFSLPVVISSMRWGVAAGRKTMVATAMLLFTLSGPVKALTYLLMHGIVGLTMGTLWRLGANWATSITLCSLVRALGACGYVLLSSFLIRENILSLITINIHASLSYILMAIGVNTIPSMDAIYVIFSSLLLLNCGFFVFLLHVLYAIFVAKLGMKASLKLPGWLDRAI